MAGSALLKYVSNSFIILFLLKTLFSYIDFAGNGQVTVNGQWRNSNTGIYPPFGRQVKYYKVCELAHTILHTFYILLFISIAVLTFMWVHGNSFLLLWGNKTKSSVSLKKPNTCHNGIILKVIPQLASHKTLAWGSKEKCRLFCRTKINCHKCFCKFNVHPSLTHSFSGLKEKKNFTK